MSFYRRVLGLVVLGSITGCSWVSPSVDSQHVALVKPTAAQNCTKLGITQSKSLSKVVFVPRADKKVQTELIVLAKNEAAIMGGDTIAVEPGTFEPGVQSFGVYRCRPAS